MSATFPSYENINAAVDITLFTCEVIVMLGCIALGSWVGGIGIGMFGCLGVAIYGFGFQMAPGAIAFDVIQLIMAAVCCIATVQVAGGLDYVIHLVNIALRRFPKMLTIFAPLLTFAMTVLCGTGHTGYAAMPVIIEVAKDAGIRPSRPLAAAVVSGQMAICASPISAAVVYFTKTLEGAHGPSYIRVLAVTIPANLIGCLLTAIVSLFLGKDLYKDETFLKRVANGTCKLRLPLPPEVEAKVQVIRDKQIRDELHPHHDGGLTAAKEEQEGPSKSLVWQPSFIESDIDQMERRDKLPSITVLGKQPANPKFGWRPKLSLVLFLIGMILVMVYALLISDSLHLFKYVVPRDAAIVSVLLTMAAIITVVCKVDPKAIANSNIFVAGMVGCICVLGVAWMADTFLKWWTPQIQQYMGETLRSQPWTLAIILWVCGAIMYSQAATAKALIPLALATRVDFRGIVASFSGVSSLFVLPTYPTMIAAVLMDDTGTTKAGRYIFDHALFVPGLIAVVGALAAGFGLSYAYLGSYDF